MYNLLNQFSKLLSIGTKQYSKYSKSNLKDLLISMPKDPKHIVEAQKQRAKIKERYQKYVPGKVSLQVLGSGAEGAPKALYMFTDQSRYLFNCGEGTQRLAHEHKMKLSKLEHIFITRPTWDNIGGLPGVSLTIQDVGVPQITLHGPDGLDELFIATKRFVVLRDLKIQMADCKQNFEDNVMTVTYVPIYERKSVDQNIESMVTETKNESSDDDTDYYAHEKNGKKIVNDDLPPISHESREQNVTMNYICRISPRPGALSLEKCVDAGVPPGPLLGQLKAGKDIILPNGKEVKSQDVCLPDDPGPVFLVIDCPTVDYIDSLVNTEVFSQHQSSASNDEDLAHLVVHFTPSHVMKDPRYQSWISKFSFSTQHLVLNDLNKCMGSLAVHRIQKKLNMLHENMFPLLGDTGTKSAEENSTDTPQKKLKTENGASPTNMIENLSVTQSDINNHLIQAQTFCTFHLRPKRGLDRSGELCLTPDQYIKETMEIEGFPAAYNELKEKLRNTSSSKSDHPNIVFLGTGSCIPNKTRNTSGILVNINDQLSFLMDCGEGTYGQLVRFYGYEKARQILTNLNAVYISHLHADHHIGLIGLLKGRRRAFIASGREPEPLLLFAPKQILYWLHIYHRRFENISEDYCLIPNGDMILNNNNLSENQKQMIKEKLQMNEVSTVPVVHCPNSFGVSFIHKDNWKITYSGDTMPSENLVALGMNSDLLIHEATMEDELIKEAICKMHSTTTQAIHIGQKMKAKYILLTHFSQRYAKLPRFNNNFAENVGIAFDNMKVTLDEFSAMPLLYPSLKLMFSEHYEELEHKAVKRQLREEKLQAAQTL